MSQTPIVAVECICGRCGARKVYETPPVRCWVCKSAYWDRPRKYKELPLEDGEDHEANV